MQKCWIARSGQLSSLKYISLFVAIFITPTYATEYSETQYKEIIGKTLWFYFDSDECRHNLPVSMGILGNKTYESIQPVRITIDKLVDNWFVGKYYEITIQDDNQTKATINSGQLNDYRGAFRYLYYTESEPDLTALNSACVSNINPEKKAALNQASRKSAENRLEQERQAAQDAYQEKARLVANEKALKLAEIKNKQNQEREDALKELPNELKEYSTDNLCLMYGNHLPQVNHFDRTDPRAINAIQNEIQSRGIKLRRSPKTSIGMNTCEMLIKFGEPDHRNTSVGKWGVHTQFVYKGLNVYTEDGIVTSVQFYN